jgi:hypothetical protein
MSDHPISPAHPQTTPGQGFYTASLTLDSNQLLPTHLLRDKSNKSLRTTLCSAKGTKAIAKTAITQSDYGRCSAQILAL